MTTLSLLFTWIKKQNTDKRQDSKQQCY